MAEVVEVTDETFDAEVTQAETLVAAEFYTQFCPVCKRLTPVFEELASDYSGKAKFVKLDVARAAESARTFAVMSAPSVLLLKTGQEVGRSVGYADKGKLASMIDAQL